MTNDRRLITEVILDALTEGRCPWQALADSVHALGARASAVQQVSQLNA